VKREEQRLDAKEFVIAAEVLEEAVEVVVCRLQLTLPLEALAKEKGHEDSA
jgi:hypothetical protein